MSIKEMVERLEEMLKCNTHSTRDEIAVKAVMEHLKKEISEDPLSLLSVCKNTIRQIEDMEELGGVNKVEGIAGFEGTKLMLKMAIEEAERK